VASAADPFATALLVDRDTIAWVRQEDAANDLTASLDLVDARLAPAVHGLRENSGLLFDLLDVFIQESGQPVVRLTSTFSGYADPDRSSATKRRPSSPPSAGCPRSSGSISSRLMATISWTP